MIIGGGIKPGQTEPGLRALHSSQDCPGPRPSGVSPAFLQTASALCPKTRSLHCRSCPTAATLTMHPLHWSSEVSGKPRSATLGGTGMHLPFSEPQFPHLRLGGVGADNF